MFRDFYKNSKRKRLARAIKQKDPEIQDITFRNKDTLEIWTQPNRKKGRPKHKWTQKAMEDMWAEIKAKNAELRHINYDHNNEQIQQAMKRHATEITKKQLG